jgi:hypothetical protein
MFDEEARSASFTETPALSIPKLNFKADCDPESGLTFSQCMHFNESLLFCTMQSGQFHVPDGFLNPSPSKTSVVGNGDDVVPSTDPFVSQVWVTPKEKSDATVTLVSPNLNPCMFEEQLSDSFTETFALSMPKLNFTVE